MIKKADEKQLYRNLQVGFISKTDKLTYEDNAYDGVICISAITRNHIMIEHAFRDFIRVLMTLIKSLKACSTIIYPDVLWSINDFNDERNFLEEHGKVIKDKKCELKHISRN